ncbi:MAG TPA: hypothetical protein VIT93_02510 [Dehalococcoidia bacterium]
MRNLARRLLYLSAVLCAFTLLSPLATPAWAEINGNCEATFKGADIRDRSSTSAGDAIDVDDNEVVVVNFTSAAGFASHDINLEVAGVSRNVSSQTDDGDTQWSETVNVKDYAWIGAGLYKVTGSATLSDGSTCSGAALINVTRNPLTTVVGGAAAATMAVGLGGVAASGVSSGMQGARTGRKIDEWVVDEVEKVGSGPKPPPGPRPMSDFEAWVHTVDLFIGPFIPGWKLPPCLVLAVPALLLTGAAMAVPEGEPPTPSGSLRLPRASWLPRITFAGLFGGLLGGIGIVVLLQQYGVTPLTQTLAITGVVAGLVVGIVIPSLVHVWSVMHVNGKIGSAERQLKQALAAAASSPEPPVEPQS